MDKLNNHPLYCFLNADEIKLLKAVGKEYSYMAHERIISIGERNRDVISLEEGSVSVQIEDIDGAVHEVARIHEGNLVGEMNFIVPTRRTANVVALTEVEAYIYPYAELCNLLAAQPTLATKVFMALNIQLCEKYLGMISP